MIGWHHQLDGHEFDQTLEFVMDKKAWHAAVHRVANSDMTKWLNRLIKS